MRIDKYKKIRGITIVETMVGITVGVAALLGILTLLIRSFGYNTDVRNKLIASNLAAEGIEVVKGILDKNITQQNPWNEGITNGRYNISFNTEALTPANSIAPLCFDGSTGMYVYDEACSELDQNVSLFTRIVEVVNTDVNENDGDHIIVSSTVSWVARGSVDSVYLEDHFFNWRNR